MDEYVVTQIEIYYSLVLTFLLATSIYIVVHFAEPQFPIRTYFTLVIGYFASFSIVVLAPIDISIAVYSRRSTVPFYDPDYHNAKSILSTSYDVFFTTILLLGSFVLVFEEYYNTDGSFHVVNCIFTT